MTANTAAVLRPPPPCTRDPIHSANTGAPVKMLMLARAIRAASRTRHNQKPFFAVPVGAAVPAEDVVAPPGAAESGSGWFTYSIVSRYSYECETCSDPSREPGPNAPGTDRRR